MEPKVKLVDYNGDVSKKWYIDYYIFDNVKQSFVRKRHFKGINTSLDFNKRYKQLVYWYNYYTNKLESGWTLNKTDYSTKAILNKSFLEVYDWVIEQKKPNLRPKTLSHYESTRKKIVEYTNKYGSIAFKQFKYEHLSHLLELTTSHLKPKSFNNEVGNFSAIYNFLDRRFPEEKIINYVKRVDKKPVPKGMKHLPYTQQQLKAISEHLTPQELLFVSFIYFCLIRPNEARHLKVSDLVGDKLKIPAITAKTNSYEFVHIPHAMNELLEKNKIRSYPEDYYIFSVNELPGTALLGKGYFYNHIRKVIDKLGYDREKYDLYSFKHTGVCSMYKAGAKIYDIKTQCRHSEIRTTEIYMKNLGLIDTSEVIMNMPSFGE